MRGSRHRGGLGGGAGPFARPGWWPDWRGRVACIIGAGPSLTGEQCNAARDRGWRCIAINESWRRAPWADALYACDATWWKARAPDETAFQGLRITQDAAYDGALRVPLVSGDDLILDRPAIGSGGNSGFQALNLALHFGARRVVLLGIDGAATTGARHWHGDHGDGLANPLPRTFEAWRAAWRAAAAQCQALGVAVVNCSPGTAVDAFPVCDVTEVEWTS